MIGLIIALLVAPVPAPKSDARVPIRQGKLRCGLPDVQRKTCGTLSSYALGPKDSYVVSFQGLISDDGLVLAYSATGRFRNGELCLAVGDRELAATRFVKGGVTLTGNALVRLREDLRAVYGDTFGKEICNRDQGLDGVFQSQAWVAGERNAEYDKDVIWVDPRDGFSLGPLPELT